MGAILSTHTVSLLLIGGFFGALLAGKACFKLMKRALKSVFIFNAAMSLGYVIVAWMSDRAWVDFVVLFNLRVFDLTFFTLLLASKINIAQALSFSKTLSFLWTIALSQIFSYQKSYENFTLSLKSRLIKKMNERSKKEFIASVFGYFFTKALYDSEEKSLALKARGLFDQH